MLDSRGIILKGCNSHFLLFNTCNTDIWKNTINVVCLFKWLSRDFASGYFTLTDRSDRMNVSLLNFIAFIKLNELMREWDRKFKG